MLCPRCNTVNKDTATACRECGLRLVGLRVTPEARKTEKKYLIAGIVTFAALVLVVILLINAVSCLSGGSACSGCGGKEVVNENVEGDWNADIVSESDNVTPTDIPEEPIIEDSEPIE